MEHFVCSILHRSSLNSTMNSITKDALWNTRSKCLFKVYLYQGLALLLLPCILQLDSYFSILIFAEAQQLMNNVHGAHPMTLSSWFKFRMTMPLQILFHVTILLSNLEKVQG